jgi:hypothetical protein
VQGLDLNQPNRFCIHPSLQRLPLHHLSAEHKQAHKESLNFKTSY